MNEELEKEVKKLVHAEVRNAFKTMKGEQEKIAKTAAEYAVDKLASEFDAMLGKASRGQAVLEATVESVKKMTESLKEDAKRDRENGRDLLEKVTKIEYISLDSETVSRVRSFIKSPVKYMIKTIAGIE